MGNCYTSTTVTNIEVIADDSDSSDQLDSAADQYPTTTTIVTDNIVTLDFIRMDQLDSAAEVWFSNILVLIKLK